MEDLKLKANLADTNASDLKKKKSSPHGKVVQLGPVLKTLGKSAVIRTMTCLCRGQTCELNGSVMGTHMTQASQTCLSVKTRYYFVFTVMARLGRGSFRCFPKKMYRTLPVSISSP